MTPEEKSAYEQGWLDAIIKAHAIAGDGVRLAEKMHQSTRPTLWGGLSRGHVEWLGYGRAATKIMNDIFDNRTPTA